MVACIIIMIKFLAVALLLAAVFADDTPTAPVWPKKFKQDFTETISFPLHFTDHTSGTYVYDEDAGCYRIERKSCKNDRYVLGSGPCTHIVNAGNRYIYRPEKNSCCFCCNASHGCGILKHDWMSGAEYIDEESFSFANGATTEAYKFNKPGLQANYIYEDVKTGQVLRINQVPDDDMIFDPASLMLEFEDDACDLPSNCSLDTKCSWSICSTLRGGEGTPTEE